MINKVMGLNEESNIHLSPEMINAYEFTSLTDKGK